MKIKMLAPYITTVNILYRNISARNHIKYADGRKDRDKRDQHIYNGLYARHAKIA